jgi:hypothetical protein
MLPDVMEHRVALSATEAIAEEFHDARVGIHCRERLFILVTPWSKADAVAGQCHKRAHRGASLCLNGCHGEFASGQPQPHRGIRAELSRFVGMHTIGNRQAVQRRPLT